LTGLLPFFRLTKKRTIAMTKCDVGLVGLAVMGRNLVLNLEEKGFRVAVFNRTASKTEAFLAGEAKGKKIEGAYGPGDFAALLERPRVILLMVKAGEAVDKAIAALLPHLEEGDILMDGGNSFFKDTERRARELEEKGIHFLGVGISGGEEGARFGPSIMPGGSRAAWERVEPMLRAAAAKVEGEPCVAWLGKGGAGHYVKMVHNGIEYGEMQLLAEAYDLLRRGLGYSFERMAALFGRWNEGILSSFLVEITARILEKKDPETGKMLVEVILDRAGQKGTGKWTAEECLERGVPMPALFSALEMRMLSGRKEERTRAARILRLDPGKSFEGDRDGVERDLENALYLARICGYAQGLSLLREAGRACGYDWDLAQIARIWRGGCIIRAGVLEKIRAVFEEDPGLENLLLHPETAAGAAGRVPALRRTLTLGAELGIPLPALSATLSFLDAYRSAVLPANLIQAQRDYFGAHTFERVDKKGAFHADWQS